MFVGWLPYEEILEIDEIGDDRCALPTVFTRFHKGQPPFSLSCDIGWEASGYRHEFRWRRNGHVRLFEPEHRDETWELGWAERNDILFSSTPFSVPAST